MNRINLITLGVKDINLSLAFYKDGLGFQTSVSDNSPTIVFFNNSGTKLSLYPIEALTKDVNDQEPEPVKGFPGFTLAYNAKSAEEVDEMMQMAKKAGGAIVKSPEHVFWGGYSGYFTDLDGYYWEVAYSKDWRFDENDMLIIE
ncbi:MAG: VOC family protein [Lysinibacillus sp.]